MMLIPKKSQVPIQQPMYTNNVMHQVWIDFFERLATLRNEASMIDIFELAQLSGELPSIANSTQIAFDIAQLRENYEAFAQDILRSIQASQDDILTLKNTTQALVTQSENFEERISALENQVGAFNGKISSLESRVTALEKKP